MAMLSYADAVKLLGAKESKIITALDKLLGGALLAGSGVDLWGLLGCGGEPSAKDLRGSGR